MIDQNVLEALSASPLFNQILREDIQLMLHCLNPRVQRYKRGVTLANFGDVFLGIGIVVEGEIVIAKESIAGNRTIMTVLKKGEMFGEMVSFSDNKVWPATVTAQSDCVVIFVSPEKVISQCDKMCHYHQKLIDNILKIMSKKALMLNRKVEYLSIRSLRGKLCAYLIEQNRQQGLPIFSLPMNRDELADFFNVARPSISRELSKMKDEGLIDFHKASFKIIDMERMKLSI